MVQPLDGIRVIDLTHMLAGPFASLILSDLGADVLKIEPPRGDPIRRNLPLIEGESAYFMSINRGKRSLSLDLKTTAGRETLLALVPEADIVVENFRPGVMERLGIGYKTLCSVNPDVILCSISGFGQTGPLRQKISFDLVNQGMAGILDLTGERAGPPVRIGLPVGDLSAGLYGTIAILSAVYYHRQSAAGSNIDLSLHDSLINMLGYLGQLCLLTGESSQRLGLQNHHDVPHRRYRAADGDIVIAAFTDKLWRNLVQALDRRELADDPRFNTRAARKANRWLVDSLIEDAIATRSCEDWMRIFDRHQVPAARVMSVDEALESPQAHARDMVCELTHPKLGNIRIIGSPFKTEDETWITLRAAPAHGQDADHVLKELLGFDDEKLNALRADGAIF